MIVHYSNIDINRSYQKGRKERELHGKHEYTHS